MQQGGCWKEVSSVRRAAQRENRAPSHLMNIYCKLPPIIFQRIFIQFPCLSSVSCYGLSNCGNCTRQVNVDLHANCLR